MHREAATFQWMRAAGRRTNRSGQRRWYGASDMAIIAIGCTTRDVSNVHGELRGKSRTMSNRSPSRPVLVAGGGIGGLVAAALALVRRGFAVEVLEQSPRLGEIGAGTQLGPNAFSAFDALGVGPKARARAVLMTRGNGPHLPRQGRRAAGA
jgi:hypothetical protein